MYPYPGNQMAIRRAVVYFARAAHAFSAGIKCRHCMRKGISGVVRILAFSLPQCLDCFLYFLHSSLDITISPSIRQLPSSSTKKPAEKIGL